MGRVGEEPHCRQLLKVDCVKRTCSCPRAFCVEWCPPWWLFFCETTSSVTAGCIGHCSDYLFCAYQQRLRPAETVTYVREKSLQAVQCKPRFAAFPNVLLTVLKIGSTVCEIPASAPVAAEDHLFGSVFSSKHFWNFWEALIVLNMLRRQGVVRGRTDGSCAAGPHNE
jgi:hypothetical protein